MTKDKYVHTIALTREEEKKLEELQKNDYGIMRIFRLGMLEAEKRVDTKC